MKLSVGLFASAVVAKGMVFYNQLIATVKFSNITER